MVVCGVNIELTVLLLSMYIHIYINLFVCKTHYIFFFHESGKLCCPETAVNVPIDDDD